MFAPDRWYPENERVPPVVLGECVPGNVEQHRGSFSARRVRVTTVSFGILRCGAVDGASSGRRAA